MARPRTALEEARFRQLSFGTTFRFVAYHRPSTSFRSAALTLLVHRDEEDSVDRPLAIPYRPTRSRLADLRFEFPLGEHLLLTAEGVLSSTDGNLLGESDASVEGHGLLVSAQFRHPSSLLLRIAYQRLSADFRSQYRAISYAPNRQGWRLAVDWEREDERCALWIFYKRLQSLDKEPRAARQTAAILSLGGRTALTGGRWLRGTWTGQRDFDAQRWSATGELSQRLGPDSEVILQYQYVDHEDAFIAALNHHTHLLSLLSSVSF